MLAYDWRTQQQVSEQTPTHNSTTQPQSQYARALQYEYVGLFKILGYVNYYTIFSFLKIHLFDWKKIF